MSEIDRDEAAAAQTVEIEALTTALTALATTRDPALASTLARLFTAVMTEATKTPRFANSLAQAVRTPEGSPSLKPKRHRRQPGPIDPFAIYGEYQEDGLRSQLLALELEQLRDILAEHRMDNDRLAMKWKDRERVIERIVERVTSRAEKGSAFS